MANEYGLNTTATTAATTNSNNKHMQRRARGLSHKTIQFQLLCGPLEAGWKLAAWCTGAANRQAGKQAGRQTGATENIVTVTHTHTQILGTHPLLTVLYISTSTHCSFATYSSPIAPQALSFLCAQEQSCSIKREREKTKKRRSERERERERELLATPLVTLQFSMKF